MKTLLLILAAVATTVICAMWVWNKDSEEKPVTESKYFNIIEIEGGTFPGTGEVVISNDTIKVLIYITKLTGMEVEMEDLDVQGLTFDNPNCPVIWLQHAPKTPEEIAAANHELFHLTCSMMKYAGLTFSDSSEEAYAYEMSYISKQFYEKVK